MSWIRQNGRKCCSRSRMLKILWLCRQFACTICGQNVNKSQALAIMVSYQNAVQFQLPEIHHCYNGTKTQYGRNLLPNFFMVSLSQCGNSLIHMLHKANNPESNANIYQVSVLSLARQITSLSVFCVIVNPCDVPDLFLTKTAR